MNYHEKIERYSTLYINSIGRYVEISHKRTRIPGGKRDVKNLPMESITHTHTGKIIIIDKASLKLLVNDEQIITIEFRTIKKSFYLDQSLKIKASLYYRAHKLKLLKWEGEKKEKPKPDNVDTSAKD